MITTIVAVLGLFLAALSLGLQAYTWRSSGSRVEVQTAFGIFPQVARNQMMDRLREATPQQSAKAQQMIEYQSQFVLPSDLGYPAFNELISVLPAESVIRRRRSRLPLLNSAHWAATPLSQGMPTLTPGSLRTSRSITLN